VPNDKHGMEDMNYQERRDMTRVFKRVEKAIIGVDNEGFNCVNEYRLVTELCSHAHGRVCICEDRVLKVQYAVKISRKVGSLSNNEVNILKNLEHPHLVHLVEVIDDPLISERYLILEFLEGGAIMVIDEVGKAEGEPYSEDDSQKYMTQLVSALDYLHGLNIVHGNIKPENILLTKDRQTCKLTDFQMSTAGLEHDTKKTRQPRGHKHEMPWFRAPEEFVPGEFVAGRACDIWALGATLYAMLFGVVAFSGTGNHEVSENIRTKALTFGETTISLPLRMLLRRMLEKDILLRITLNEILDDPWVSGEGIWQGKSRERYSARGPPKRAATSQFEMLKRAASKKKTDRVAGRHILVAEDVFLVRELVVRMLKGIVDVSDTDVHIDGVVDGDEAVEAMHKKSYGLVFMDLHMSRMSGFEATLQIRDYENASNLEPCAIIGLTGDLHEEINEVCLKVGMNEIASKPLRPNQARALVERYGYKVNWAKPLVAKSLTSNGRSNVFLKSYCRFLENHGEALQVADDGKAIKSFLILHSRRQLPFFEPSNSDQRSLKAIVGFLGYHGDEETPSEDDEQDEEAEASTRLLPVPTLGFRQAAPIGEFKGVITKRAESVRMGVDSCGKRFVNEYTLLTQLGIGAYGTVYKVVNTFNEQVYALKSANKRQLTKSVGSFRLEVEILQTLNHANVIKVYEIIDDPNSQEVFFVMEYIEGGSVATVDPSGKLNKRLVEAEARRLMVQCIAGLEYLHCHHVVHRDIKPDNILLFKATGTYKLSDFGVSHFLSSDADDALKNLSGTPLFAAPETCKGDGESYSGKAADIWALGITLYGLIYGQVPFEVTSQFQLFKDIQTKEIIFPDRPKVSSELRLLLNRMLEKDVLLRITGPEVRDHSWLTGKENIIRKVSKEVREANKKKRVGTASQPILPVNDGPGPKNVLIVEDVFLVRELLRKMFFCVLDIPKEGEGEFCIECVADGDEAIDAYNSRRYHLILMDVHMPKVSGFDATLRMREIEIDKGLPRAAIVGQTGDVHERINEVCMEVGMDEVVQKPLTPSLLRGICLRYGFPVKKNAPIPKDLFDKGHAFTSSFKQYLERCDPGFLQGKIPPSMSAIKLAERPSNTNESNTMAMALPPAHHTESAHRKRIMEVAPEECGFSASTGTVNTTIAQPLAASETAASASLLEITDIHCAEHPPDQATRDETPCPNGTNPSTRLQGSHHQKRPRIGNPSESDNSEEMRSPNSGNDRRPLQPPGDHHPTSTCMRGGYEVTTHEPNPTDSSASPTATRNPEMFADAPSPTITFPQRPFAPHPASLALAAKGVSPKAFLAANQKPSILKALQPREVIPVIQTLLIAEVQKRHENVTQFLTDEEIVWVRQQTTKLYEQSQSPDPELHTPDGVDETQLRRVIHAALPATMETYTLGELPRHFFTAYAAQECGRRDAQEDTFVCLNRLAHQFDWEATGTPIQGNARPKELMCCAVYDGHGGRSASEYCRNQFHLFVLRALSDGKTLQDALPLAMADCNAVYNEKAEKAGSNAGTTAALLFIAEDDDGGATLVTANVGDCRIVFFSGGKAVDLTRDHKPTNEAEKQRIESLGGEVVYNSGAWRVNGVLTVSRAIGSVRSCQKYLSCVPDIITHKLQPTDQFAVIASDGLWNVMSSEEVVDFVAEAKAEIDAAGDVMDREEGAMDADEEEEDDSGSMTYQLIADGLVSHAIDDLKSDDNVTVIIVFFDHSYREKCE